MTLIGNSESSTRINRFSCRNKSIPFSSILCILSHLFGATQILLTQRRLLRVSISVLTAIAVAMLCHNMRRSMIDIPHSRFVTSSKPSRFDFWRREVRLRTSITPIIWRRRRSRRLHPTDLFL